MEAQSPPSDRIHFEVASNLRTTTPGRWVAYLIEDNWDDWAKFQTQFRLYFYDGEQSLHELGDVKIGQFGLKPSSRSAQLSVGERRPTLPPQFEQLDDSFFSLGQSDNYYEQLGRLDPRVRDLLAKALRDVVFDGTLFHKAINEEAMGESLLRSVQRKNVEEQFARLFAGGARLSPYAFDYEYPKIPVVGEEPLRLSFRVIPESLPPTNIHVIIGRNSVGKTYTLNLMTKALLGVDQSPGTAGQFLVTPNSPPTPLLIRTKIRCHLQI
jgi:hypothetical protein